MALLWESVQLQGWRARNVASLAQQHVLLLSVLLMQRASPVVIRLDHVALLVTTVHPLEFTSFDKGLLQVTCVAMDTGYI